MKLQDNTIEIEQIGTITDASSFKMKSSRKAFQILSDLYSDKPLAIVRELGCNANDAMTMAGKKDQPFHIHVPNALEPWLTIQDFGTGISHQNIYDIYSTYFESTKTNTNDQIGCLGLGSKSPFCYTDNFSVTSIFDGEKRIYNAYFAENGNPTIALMSTAKTSEGNGVAIQIPIKEKDFNNFYRSIATAFRYFDVKPTISGGTINWHNETPMFTGDDWMFYDNNQGWQSFAIMGGVTYPIDSQHTDDKYNNILRKGIVLKFAMGELDFAPSREHLSYDDATIKAINDKLEKVTHEIKVKAKEQILSKDNILEAIRSFLYYNDRFAYYGNASFEIKNLIYNGKDITEPFKFAKTIVPNVQGFFKRSYRKTICQSTGFTFDKTYIWFYNDGTIKNPVNRVKMYVRDTEKSAMIFTMEDKKNMIDNGFPSDLFVSASTLPSPSVKRKVNNNGNLVVKAKEDITCYEIGDTYHVSWSSMTIEPTCTTLPEYYIVKGKTWELDIKPNGLRKIESKDRLKHYCDCFGFNVHKVVMASEKEVKKLKARGVKDFVSALNKKIDLSWIDMEEVKIILSYSDHRLDDIVKHPNYKLLSDTNPIKEMIVKIKTLHTKYDKIKNVLNYLDNKAEGAYKMPDPAYDFILSELLTSYGTDQGNFLLIAKKLEK